MKSKLHIAMKHTSICSQELNDRKRLATSGANFARAYTVEFGTCKFPENFTGCQDLAKQKVGVGSAIFSSSFSSLNCVVCRV